MSIDERLVTNPELLEANRLVGDVLNDLIDRRWGTVTMSFSAQNGHIVTMRINEERVLRLSPDPINEKV